jgi:hypothetical protein
MGGTESVTCGYYDCSCPATSWHPEWAEWTGYYCSKEDATTDVLAHCGPDSTASCFPAV